MRILEKVEFLVPTKKNAIAHSIPCEIDYEGISYKDHSYSITLSKGEIFVFNIGAVAKNSISLQLTNFSVFSTSEIRELAKLLDFDLLALDSNPNILRGVLLNSPDPDNILRVDFHFQNNRRFCVIRKINGRPYIDFDLPFIWRVVEIELSPELIEKLNHYWKEETVLVKNNQSDSEN